MAYIQPKSLLFWSKNSVCLHLQDPLQQMSLSGRCRRCAGYAPPSCAGVVTAQNRTVFCTRNRSSSSSSSTVTVLCGGNVRRPGDLLTLLIIYTQDSMEQRCFGAQHTHKPQALTLDSLRIRSPLILPWSAHGPVLWVCLPFAMLDDFSWLASATSNCSSSHVSRYLLYALGCPLWKQSISN
ncbi:hypothetical protein BC835DRAFT_634375 [Cytidiella melzeri]|nr:hypothetical protein BC835DRAFT_634375 [Cytidiella melzeri]